MLFDDREEALAQFVDRDAGRGGTDRESCDGGAGGVEDRDRNRAQPELKLLVGVVGVRATSSTSARCVATSSSASPARRTCPVAEA